MFYQCSSTGSTFAVVIPRGPDIVGRDGCYPRKVVVMQTRARAGDHAPLGTIPMFNQRWGSCTVKGASHGPDITAGDGYHFIEVVATWLGIGARDNTPFRAIPVLGKCIIGGTVGKVSSHSPDVVC